MKKCTLCFQSLRMLVFRTFSLLNMNLNDSPTILALVTMVFNALVTVGELTLLQGEALSLSVFPLLW